jgi:hypothetical protein
MYHPIIQQTQIQSIKILFSTPLMTRIPPKPNTMIPLFHSPPKNINPNLQDSNVGCFDEFLTYYYFQSLVLGQGIHETLLHSILQLPTHYSLCNEKEIHWIE